MSLTVTQTIITLSYTLAALIAVGLHVANLRENILNQHAIREVKDRLGREWAVMQIRVEAIRLIKAFIMLILGVGVYFQVHYIGFILIAIPLLGIWGSIKDLQSRQKQTLYAQEILRKEHDDKEAS